MQTPTGDDFDVFAVRHLARLAQVADLLTGDRAAADRVVVDAFVGMYRTWPSHADDHAQVAAARRSLTATYRRSAQGRGSRGQDGALELADDFGAASELPMRMDAIWEALGDLATRERTVLVWRIFDQLPDRSIAETLRVPALSIARSARRGMDHVGMTVGLTTEDEIGGQHDTDTRNRIAAEIADCFAARHRGETDLAPLLARIRAATAGVTPRRSRTRPALLAGAAVVLVLAGVATAWWWPDQPEADGALPALPSLPIAPAGTRLVGYGEVAVAVPTSWGHNTVYCGKSSIDTVIYPDAAQVGGCSARVGISSVTFADPPPYPSPYRKVPGEIGQVGERVVLGTAVNRTDAGYEQTLVVPVSGFSMVVRSPERSVVLELAASMRVVPDGFTVVPSCRGKRLRDATADLVEAGLKPVINQASTLSDRHGQPPVTFQSIDSGQLVPTGSRVSLSVPSF